MNVIIDTPVNCMCLSTSF